MTAAELRALAERAKWYSSQTFVPAYKETFAKAAEILELLAWAEENKAEVEFGGRFWWVKVDGFLSSGPTYIGTLRRAREVRDDK